MNKIEEVITAKILILIKVARNYVLPFESVWRMKTYTSSKEDLPMEILRIKRKFFDRSFMFEPEQKTNKIQNVKFSINQFVALWKQPACDDLALACTTTLFLYLVRSKQVVYIICGFTSSTFANMKKTDTLSMLSYLQLHIKKCMQKIFELPASSANMSLKKNPICFKVM